MEAMEGELRPRFRNAVRAGPEEKGHRTIRQRLKHDESGGRERMEERRGATRERMERREPGTSVKGR